MSSNVDSAEIAKFEALAHRWWDKQSEFKPLHEINPLRANYIDLHSPVAESQLLDVGCGGGILCEAMAQRGAQVSGIDMGAAPLAVAKLHQLESQLTINYRQCTAEALAGEEAGHLEQHVAQYWHGRLLVGDALAARQQSLEIFFANCDLH